MTGWTGPYDIAVKPVALRTSSNATLWMAVSFRRAPVICDRMTVRKHCKEGRPRTL